MPGKAPRSSRPQTPARTLGPAKPPRIVAPDGTTAHTRNTRNTVLAFGVGLVATGVGAVLGLAAERAAMSRRKLLGDPGAAATDGRGGPELGSLQGRSHVVTSGGASLHVEVDEPEESPPLTVVLTHGYSLSLDAWHYQRLALRGHYRLVLWDQRGHGRSGAGEDGSSTIDQIGRDLAAVIDEVAPQGPLVLLGHSMGGMTVMALAEQRPELFAERVVGVGLFCTSAGGLGPLDLGLSGVGRAMMSLAPAAARLLASRPSLVAHGRRIGSDLESLLVRRYSFASPVPQELVRFSAGLIAQTRMEVISDFLPGLGSHDKRVALAVLDGHALLVMAGEDDLLIPRAHSDDIVASLPDAEYVVVRQAGHLLPLEHPDLVNAYLLELMTDASAAVRDRKPSRRRGWGRRTVTPVRQPAGERAEGRANDQGGRR
ncbi:alpha/beta hydrolase [Kineosporia sp. NBRC 101731]|uniref:alpha/beta fold hydrolase n=1 Tax=Kineosporia sp. NBRC 101731 TaxID=3032199 RepID=UPI00249FEA98|nr:alpha/beta hydrolase [Kineosporia sp. NBRC 101731]GLY27734.1 lipase [Kineosporia sp. NBRC 101731]